MKDVLKDNTLTILTEPAKNVKNHVLLVKIPPPNVTHVNTIMDTI
jgi:hypothetical protein